MHIYVYIYIHVYVYTYKYIYVEENLSLHKLNRKDVIHKLQ
jgi:hypothetical protein